MKATDVMVRDVVTVKPETDVVTAIKLLVEHDISALPVLDQTGTVIGVISEADLVRRTEIGTEKQRPWWLEALTPGSILAEEFSKSHGRTVGEIISPHVVSASEDTSIGEIAALLERHRIKRVPIIKDGKLIGIVSRSNLIQALALASPPRPDPAAAEDRNIRLELLSRLGDQKWTDFGSRNVIVAGGVVHRLARGANRAHRSRRRRARRCRGVGRDDSILRLTMTAAHAATPSRSDRLSADIRFA
jgi:CBS-domain-containing membrane protein